MFSMHKSALSMEVVCPVGWFLLNVANKIDHCSPCPAFESSVPWLPSKCITCQDLLLESTAHKSSDFWGNENSYLSYSGYVAHKLCHDRPDLLYPKVKEATGTDDKSDDTAATTSGDKTKDKEESTENS